MKKAIFIPALILLLTVSLAGCCLSHEWQDATCTTPKMCLKCSKTEGSILPHLWEDATCERAQICSVCGETGSAALEHSWTDADGHTSKVCSVCSAVNYADSDFLAALKEAIGKRVALAENDASYEELTEAEKTMIGQYRELEYEDENLQTLASKYISGVQTQINALGLSQNEFQFLWSMGIILRYEALSDLQEQYHIFDDDNFFRTHYAPPFNADSKY